MMHYNGKGGLNGIIDDFFVRIKLVNFMKKYKKVYIYGCGFWGNHLSYVLENWCIEFEGFCQTKKQFEIFNGYSVIEFTEQIAANKEVGFIIAMNKEKASEVLREMDNHDCTNRTFVAIRV